MKKTVTKKYSPFFIIMLIITGLYIAFILWHSTMNAEESTVESTSVLDFLNNLIRALGLSAELTDYAVRKSAHFCEFALLGCLTMWDGWLKNKRVVRNLMPAGFVCLACGVADECVQLGSPGRSSEVTDVVVDFSGACAGAVFFMLILFVNSLFKATPHNSGVRIAK